MCSTSILSHIFSIPKDLIEAVNNVEELANEVKEITDIEGKQKAANVAFQAIDQVQKSLSEHKESLDAADFADGTSISEKCEKIIHALDNLRTSLFCFPLNDLITAKILDFFPTNTRPPLCEVCPAFHKGERLTKVHLLNNTSMTVEDFTAYLERHPCIEILSIPYNLKEHVNELIPLIVGKCPWLRSLDLHNTSISDAGLAHLARLKYLFSLNLACCRKITRYNRKLCLSR